MKILMIPAWYPQNENDITASFFREQAHAFADNGHEVTVLHIEYLSVKLAFKKPWITRTEWLDGNVRTVFVKQIIPVPIQLTGFQEKLISSLFTREINRVITEYGKPDVIHAHVSHSCGYYCINAAQKLKLPLIVTEHYSGLLLGTASEDDFRRVKITMEQADAFVFVGTNFRNSICDRFGLDRENYLVIPNMVIMPSSYSPDLAKKEKSSSDPFVFLTACHLKKHKSVDLVIKAFHDEFNPDENVRLKIAGDGDERSNLETLVNDLNENRVSFFGRYSREEMPGLFSSADSFVLVDQVETFGIVYVEALMCGIPIIATEGQGAEDIVNESNGLKVQYNDIPALKKALRYVCEHNYNKKSIVMDCISHFSAVPILEKYNKLFMDSIHNH